MWFLDLPSEEIIKRYKDKMLDGLLFRIKDKLEKDVQEILIPNNKTENIEQLLIAKPIEHYELNKMLMKKIISNYDENDFPKYLQNSDSQLQQKYTILSKIHKAFDYETQISSNKSRSFELAKQKAVRVCPYCGRQYIFTVVQQDSNGNNNRQRITRPEFDHWFSKQLFPLLSLNWYNLIPSCHICNSTLKGNAIFSLESHIHPYIHDSNCRFQFESRYKPNGEYGVQIKNISNPKVEKMLEEFSIRDIYDYHGELEVKDIINRKKKYESQQVKLIIDNLSKLHPDIDEDMIYKIIFEREITNAQNLDRPLSKLEHDILVQIKIIPE